MMSAGPKSSRKSIVPGPKASPSTTMRLSPLSDVPGIPNNSTYSVSSVPV